jgi:glycosyltransferase involved in cell wall biosynthesis
MNIVNVKEKLRSGKKLRVLFLNDLGFQYGAGIAELRQIQSFLLMGHEVRGVCWTDNIESSIPFIPPNASGVWLGMRQLPHVHVNQGFTEEQIIHTLLEEVKSNLPDVLIVGNLHASAWPLQLLPSLQALGVVVIAFMHDCYYITGRCTHPFDCPLYATGCDERCPTADRYPILARDKIAGAWRLRQDIFCNQQGIFLATNSRWTLNMAQRAMPKVRYADVIHLGLDERLFKPIDRSLARRLLGLPQDEFIILGGAINVDDPHKGGHIFKDVAERLGKESLFLAFGAETSGLRGVKATGLLRDYRKMPLLYSAADLFIATSLAESFGQTFLEAAACALPIVAFRIGGIPESARHNINARLVDEIDTVKLLAEIQFFMNNQQKRIAFGQAGRAMVEKEFTLEQQAERWLKYFKAISTL